MKLKNILKELEHERKSLADQLHHVERIIEAAVGVGARRTGKSKKAPGTKRRKKMSKAGRLAIAAAQRARWAKVAGKKARKKMSKAGRAAIAAAQRARWAKIKAAKK